MADFPYTRHIKRRGPLTYCKRDFIQEKLAATYGRRLSTCDECIAAYDADFLEKQGEPWSNPSL